MMSRARRPAPSPRGQGSRRIAALLSPAKGHRPSRALDFALRGRDGGLRQGGKGERLAAANGLWNSYALRSPGSRRKPRGAVRRAMRLQADPSFLKGTTSEI